MVALAVVLAVAPIFTDCESQGRFLTTAEGRSLAMKCHWTGIAEIAAAVPLAIAGLVAAGSKRKETSRVAGIFGLGSAAMALLLPTVLIGTCMSASMPCNLLMRPILLTSGTLAAVASIAVVLTAREAEPLAAASAV